MHTAPIAIDAYDAVFEQDASSSRTAIRTAQQLLKALAILFPLAAAGVANAGEMDPDLVWPLCGRLAENAPPGWDGETCPADRFGDSAHTDLPIASTFGPRHLASEDDRYDFHRGIDLATPRGTPIFAIADGEVKIAGEHPSYADALVQLRHLRPGESSCADAGCYHSNYSHLDGWVVSEGDLVQKGDLLGYTGASASGFEHLHFEIRDAAAEDPYSRWNRDAVHPLGALPYDPAGEGVSLGIVGGFEPGQARPIEVAVATDRPDLVRLELELLGKDGRPIDQQGDKATASGSFKFPSWWDANVWNRMYTHKNSSALPWAAFGAGGTHECAFHGSHPESYTAHAHLDDAAAGDPHTGAFNGVKIQPGRRNGAWHSQWTFDALRGDAVCVRAIATTADGAQYATSAGVCAR